VGLEAKWNAEAILAGFMQVDRGFLDVWQRTEEQTKTSEYLRARQLNSKGLPM
jgi:hypothetical protein